jgi:hypothetical protein
MNCLKGKLEIFPEKEPIQNVFGEQETMFMPLEENKIDLQAFNFPKLAIEDELSPSIQVFSLPLASENTNFEAKNTRNGE